MTKIKAYAFVDRHVKKQIRKAAVQQGISTETGDPCLPLWQDIEDLPPIKQIPYNFTKHHLVSLESSISKEEQKVEIQLPSDDMFDEEMIMIPEHILRSEMFLKYLKQQQVRSSQTEENKKEDEGLNSDHLSSELEGGLMEESDDVNQYLSEFEDFHMTDADCQTDDEMCQYLSETNEDEVITASNVNEAINSTSYENEVINDVVKQEDQSAKLKSKYKSKKDKKKDKEEKKKLKKLKKEEKPDTNQDTNDEKWVVNIPIKIGRFEIPQLNEFQNHIRTIYGASASKQFKSVKDLDKKCCRTMNMLHRDVMHGPSDNESKIKNPRYKIADKYREYIRIQCTDPDCGFELRFRKHFKDAKTQDEIDYIKFDVSTRKFHSAPLH